MSGGYHKVDQEEINFHDVKPWCRECGKPLQDGDQIDGYFPYFTDHNLCKSCEQADVKGQRKRKWEEEMKEAKPTNDLEKWFAEECVKNLRDYRKWVKETRNVDKNSINGYARGYREGLLRKTMSIIAMSPISKQSWQAAGLTFEELEECQLTIIG